MILPYYTMFSENTGTYVKLEETSSGAPTIAENLEQPEEPQEELLSELKEPEQTSYEPTTSDPTVAEKTANKCIMGCSVM